MVSKINNIVLAAGEIIKECRIVFQKLYFVRDINRLSSYKYWLVFILLRIQ